LRPGLFNLGKKFSPFFEYAAWLAPIPIWTSWNGRTIDCLCREAIRDCHDHCSRLLQLHSNLILLYLMMYNEDYRLLTSSYNLMSLLLIPLRIPNSATGVLFGIVCTNVRPRGPETKSDTHTQISGAAFLSTSIFTVLHTREVSCEGNLWENRIMIKP
jgi:hypothetical protein